LENTTTDELIDKIVKRAIKEYSKEQKVDRERKALHNTKLYLRIIERYKLALRKRYLK